MKIVRQKLTLKALLVTLLILAILGSVLIGLKYVFHVEHLNSKEVLILSTILILGALFLFVHSVVYPINKVLREMKALLTGHKYNRIYSKRIDEVGVIAHFFNEITHSLERVSVDIKDQRRMSSELEIASQIQKDILPREAPVIQDLNVIAKSRSAAEIGGDTFDFIPIKDNTFFYLGDVTGHGVPSGLVMMMVDTLIHTFTGLYDNAYDIVTNTNRFLKPRINSTMFMTMVMFRWHHPTKKMYYVGAGHEHILVYKARTRTCQVEKSGGIALGMIPDISKYTKEKELDFEPGDTLIVYSDGITEHKNTQGEMFGLKRLVKIFETMGADNASVNRIFHQLSAEFTEFTDQHVQEDDMTIIITKHHDSTKEHEIESTSWNEKVLGKDTLIQYR